MSAVGKAKEKSEALERALEAEIAKCKAEELVREEERARPKKQQKTQSDDFDSQSCYTAYGYPSNHAYIQQQQPQTRPTTAKPRLVEKPKTTQYDIWWSLVENAFFNYPSMTAFPEPPILATCIKPDACAAEKGRKVKACDCQIEAAFQYLVEHCGRNVKTERLRWHPDRFAQVSEELKQEFTQKAGEVFKVVSRMYERGLEPTADTVEIN